MHVYSHTQRLIRHTQTHTEERERECVLDVFCVLDVVPSVSNKEMDKALESMGSWRYRKYIISQNNGCDGAVEAL